MTNNIDINQLINKNKWDEIYQLIINNKLDLNKEINNKNTIVDIACVNNKTNIIKYIADTNIHLLGKADSNGDNCLHHLAKYGYNDMIKKCLLSDNSFVNLKNKNNQTILNLLIDNYKMFKWVLSTIPNIDIDNLDNNQFTLLLIAIDKTNNIDDDYYLIIKLIVEYGCDINYPLIMSPLCYASHTDKVHVIDYLIKCGADINLIDESLMSPLLISINNNNYETVELLIENGANINYIGPEANLSALKLATEINNYHIIKLLLDKGADVNLQDKKLNTILHNMLYNKYNNKINYKHDLVSHMLLTTNLNITNIENQTVLDIIKENNDINSYNIIIDNNRIKTNDLFLKTKTPINMLDKINMTPNDKNGIFNSNIVHSMIYTIVLLNKYNNLCFAFKFFNNDIQKNEKRLLSLNCYKTNTMIGIIDFYDKYMYESLPHLILWKDVNINYIDPNINIYIQKCLLSKHIRFIFFKLTLMFSNVTNENEFLHAGIIIFDKKMGILERFEPYGRYPMVSRLRNSPVNTGVSHERDNIKNLDDFLMKNIGRPIKQYLSLENRTLQYIGPSELYINVGPQNMSDDGNIEVKKLGDPVGYCLAWCLWYLELRLMNPDIKPQILLQKSVNKIITDSKSSNNKFIDFIRKYADQLNIAKNKWLVKSGVKRENIYNMIYSDDDTVKIKKYIRDNLTENLNKKI